MVSSDKRTVATDALETLGTIIDEKAGRDAIHLAVEPAIAAHPLSPGTDVEFADGVARVGPNPVGIVDPFLKGKVFTGQRFWLVVYPRQVTSLRHVWTHPSFPDESQLVKADASTKEASEAWLRNFCGSGNTPGYETVLKAASGQPCADPDEYGTGYSNDGEYLRFHGRDAYGEIPSEFWDHVEIVTGKKITQRPKSFACSC